MPFNPENAVSNLEEAFEAEKYRQKQLQQTEVVVENLEPGDPVNEDVSKIFETYLQKPVEDSPLIPEPQPEVPLGFVLGCVLIGVVGYGIYRYFKPVPPPGTGVTNLAGMPLPDVPALPK